MTLYTTSLILPPMAANPPVDKYHFTFSLHFPLLSASCYIIFLVLLISGHYYLSILFLVIFAFIQWFYRLPTYAIDISPSLINNNSSFIQTIKSPSYGKILEIAEYDDYYRIITYLSVTDVHYQYFPISGRVIDRKYQKGTFHPAHLLEKTQYNERCHTMIEQQGKQGPFMVEVIQIAGILARRIDTFYNMRRIYEQGNLLGLIHFGSRVDTIIPRFIGKNQVKIVVREGQKVIGGQTIMAISDGFR